MLKALKKAAFGAIQTYHEISFTHLCIHSVKKYLLSTMCHSLSQVLCVHIMESTAYVYGVTGHVCLPFLTNFTPLIRFFQRLRTTDQWAN